MGRAQTKTLPMHFHTMVQADVPQGRNGKHKEIVTAVLKDLDRLTATALSCTCGTSASSRTIGLAFLDYAVPQHNRASVSHLVSHSALLFSIGQGSSALSPSIRSKKTCKTVYNRTDLPFDNV